MLWRNAPLYYAGETWSAHHGSQGPTWSSLDLSSHPSLIPLLQPCWSPYPFSNKSGILPRRAFAQSASSTWTAQYPYLNAVDPPTIQKLLPRPHFLSEPDHSFNMAVTSLPPIGTISSTLILTKREMLLTYSILFHSLYLLLLYLLPPALGGEAGTMFVLFTSVSQAARTVPAHSGH